jgi:hypothetical protein
MTPPPEIEQPVEGRRRGQPRRPPSVSNATRVIVGFPFSTIKVQDSVDATAIAALLARLCQALASNRPAADLQSIADDAAALANRLAGDR